MKIPLVLGGLIGLSLFVPDHPRYQIPLTWHHPLTAGAGGEFHIERQGDLTLKYVTVPVESGILELIPVLSPTRVGRRVRSVEDIAASFSGETHRDVLAAVNGGFFDPASGLPIGFLLRDGDMEFFNMPQGFPRSMIGFGPTVSIISPKDMPKVYLKARSGFLGVHHINVPGGANAFGVFTPLYRPRIKSLPGAIYLLARRDGVTPHRYCIETRLVYPDVCVPEGHLIIVLQGKSRAYAAALPVGSAVRLGWSLPEKWQNQKIVHGLLAGPRLLQKGVVHVTAAEERLAKLKSADRMAIGVKATGETILLWAHQDAGNLDFERLAQVLAAMGATEAIALDGGHSRALLAQTPALNVWEHYFEGGRPVANAILVALRKP